MRSFNHLDGNAILIEGVLGGDAAHELGGKCNHLCYFDNVKRSIQVLGNVVK